MLLGPELNIKSYSMHSDTYCGKVSDDAEFLLTTADLSKSKKMLREIVRKKKSETEKNKKNFFLNGYSCRTIYHLGGTF